MKAILILLLVLLGLSALTIFLLQTPGHVLLSLGELKIEVSLLVFVFGSIAGFIALYVLFRLIGWFWRVPSRVSATTKRFRAEKASGDLIKGMLQMSQGNWAKADKLLTRSANNSSTPLLNYLAAARAAQKLGNSEKRDDYLRLAHESAPNSEFAVGLTQAELQYAQGQTELALATLGKLREQAPKHSYLLALTGKCYNKLQDWQKLFDLLPDLRRTAALTTDETDGFEHGAALGLMQQAADNNNLSTLQNLWSQLSKALQTDSHLLRTYIAHLRKLDNDASAETVIRKYLDRHWNDDIAYDFGLLKHGNPTKALAHAESWLTSHKDNAMLLLTLGRLSKEAQLWGKARTYLESSIGIQPMVETYAELAELLEQIEDTDAAQSCYRKGLDLALVQAS